MAVGKHLRVRPDFVNETATTSNGEIWAVCTQMQVFVRYFPDGPTAKYTAWSTGVTGTAYAFRVFILFISNRPRCQFIRMQSILMKFGSATQRGVARF